MIALRTSLNGRALCVAGTEDLHVLNCIVNAVGKLGDLSTPLRDSDEPPDLFLTVGGLTGRADSDDEHLRWIEHLELVVGDEILIRVEDTENADAPVSKIAARSVGGDFERLRFEEAKKTYLELREKFEGPAGEDGESRRVAKTTEASS